MRFPAKHTLVWIALPLALVLIVLLFFPFRYRIEFDTDEGINAIKAMMVLRGYRLYGQIWSDQPPLLTFLLAAWFRIFGLRLTAGRLLVLLFSAVLMALGAAYTRKRWGTVAAVCTGLTLFLLPYYLRLSVSIMIGLPAIALAFASFYLLTEWHARPSIGRIVASASLLGLSILTKGFTAILIPVFLTGIIAATWSRPELASRGGRRWLGPAAWLATLGVFGLILLLIVRPEHVGQLLTVHLGAIRSDLIQTEVLPSAAERRSLASYLAESWFVFTLALVGVWRAARGKHGTALYLAGWIVAGLALLAATRPTWYHHQLLVTIPAAVLASVAVATSVQDVRQRRLDREHAPRLAASLISLGLFVAFLTVRLPGTIDALDPGWPNLTGPDEEEEEERSLLAAMNDHAAQTRWLYTDRPIFAFLSGIPVPPNLAVISAKRLGTGDLTEDEITSTLEEYAPEMILNARFGLPEVEEYMRTRNFTRIDETLKYRLYLRRPSP